MQDGTQAMVQQPAQIAQGQQVIQLASSSLATQQQAAITTTESAAATSSTTSAQPHQQAGSGMRWMPAQPPVASPWPAPTLAG